jgi:peptide/nickel transport system substrate-binding protein
MKYRRSGEGVVDVSDATWSRRRLLRSGGLAAAGVASGVGTAITGWMVGGDRDARAEAAPATGAPVRGGTLKVAQIGDPPTLDPMSSTTDVVATDTQTIFEGLFALDASGTPRPMLAAGAQWSNGNLRLTLPLRPGVVFHDGTPMTASDAAASILRWLKLAALGQQAAKVVKSVTASGDAAVIDLTQPFGMLPAYLANPNNMAAVMPRTLIDRYGDKPIPTPVGTGPYTFKEWKPDAYLKLARWDRYAPRSDAPSGYAGRRVAYLDEIDFLPIPEANTRLAGMQSGEYDVAFSIPADQYAIVTATPSLAAAILKPDSWLIFNLNKKMRLFTDPKLRQAFRKALASKPIMEAAFGPQAFWSIASPTIAYLAYEDDRTGADVFDHQDVQGARSLLKEAGYDGTAVVWLGTTNYEFFYKAALVAKSQLEAVGFKIDLQIMDWATLVQRRARPELYDVFQTGMGGIPAIPTAMDAFVSGQWPGWWSDPRKDALIQRFQSSVALPDRKAAWSGVQRLFYDDAVAVKVGDYYQFYVAQKRVRGLTVVPYQPFWNTWIAKG